METFGKVLISIAAAVVIVPFLKIVCLLLFLTAKITTTFIILMIERFEK